MTRRSWFRAMVSAAILALAAAWFALNARELSRPEFASLADLVVASEDMPLPPAPFFESPSAVPGGLDARTLFAPAASASSTAPYAPPEADGPVTRTVLSALVGMSRDVGADAGVESRVIDPMRAALSPARPAAPSAVESHGLAPESLTSDLAESGEDGESIAPAYAPSPRAHPSRRGGVAQPIDAEADGAANAETSAAAEAASDLAQAPAEEASQPASQEPSQEASQAAAQQEPAAEAAQPEETASAAPAIESLDGVILLGVFEGRSRAHALVMTAEGDTQRVRSGDAVGGWRVAGFGDDFIRLRQGNRTRLLRMPSE